MTFIDKRLYITIYWVTNCAAKVEKTTKSISNVYLQPIKMFYVQDTKIFYTKKIILNILHIL